MRIVVACMLAALCMLAAAGCTVEVGAGTIDPIAVDQPIDADGVVPPVSFSMEAEFLSEAQTAEIADRYGGKLHAVDHIDVEIEELDVTDDFGAPIDGTFVALTVDGVTLDGQKTRVRLSSATKQEVLRAVSAREGLSVPVQICVGWPPGETAAMTAHARLQPIVVVNALDAL